jgi:hypothetical protein
MNSYQEAVIKLFLQCDNQFLPHLHRISFAFPQQFHHICNAQANVLNSTNSTIIRSRYQTPFLQCDNHFPPHFHTISTAFPPQFYRLCNAPTNSYQGAVIKLLFAM